MLRVGRRAEKEVFVKIHPALRPVIAFAASAVVLGAIRRGVRRASGHFSRQRDLDAMRPLQQKYLAEVASGVRASEDPTVVELVRRGPKTETEYAIFCNALRSESESEAVPAAAGSLDEPRPRRIRTIWDDVQVQVPWNRDPNLRTPEEWQLYNQFISGSEQYRNQQHATSMSVISGQYMKPRIPSKYLARLPWVPLGYKRPTETD